MAIDKQTQSNVTDADAKRVKPTLFIGLGGTGAQIIMRLRRRIVSEFWGKSRVRLDSIADFPAARFLHIDLDQAEVSGSREAGDTDPLRAAVKFLPTERVVESLDFPAYQKGNRMQNFPHIRAFYPDAQLKDLQIDTSTGAGQIRAISRLYFYDKVTQIRTAVEGHLRELQAGVSHQTALSRLGLETGADRRVVVIASAAGGTGSGSFLDMGFLAKALNVGPDGPVELILLLPSGYSGANKDATEANSYAALMELDACMSGATRYVHPDYGWGPGHEDVLPGAEVKPYDAVFLADTKNMADVVTNSVDDVYHMMADILFEDFMPGDFADAKRSIDVNQKAHRALPHRQNLGDEGEGAVELYPLVYSSIGQCTMESPQNAERFARHLRESRERVRALFQIVQDSQDISPGQKEVNEYLQGGALKIQTDTDADFTEAVQEQKIPEGATDIITSPPCSGELSYYIQVKELLGEENALDHNLLEYVQEKFSDLLASDDPEAKKEGIQTAKKEILHEIEIASGDRDSGRRWRQIEDNGRKVVENLWEGVKQDLYARLDDRKRGGLDYVVALIKAVQGRLQAPGNGVLSKLQDMVKQYQDLVDLLLGENGFNHAAERLAETRRGFLGGGAKKAGIISEEMQTYLYWALRIKLLQKATEELAKIYAEVAVRLGTPIGADKHGNECYDGLLGDLMENRGHVRETIDLLESMVRRAEQQQHESYAMRIRLPVGEESGNVDVTDPQAIQDWAENVFGVTGSEAIFAKLQTQADQLSFVNKMLDYADQKDAEIPNIRISDLLRKMDAPQRLEQFRQVMRRAAPWGGVRKGPNFMGLKSDNFVVLISSGDSEFAKRFGEEIKQSLPGGMGVSPDRVQFPSLSSRSEQGKIVAYMRVDGFALDNIQDLRRWRTSYNQRIQKLPVHTSKLARYRHPIIPTPDERIALRESLKTFYAAIVLGVLERANDGVYQGIIEGSRLGCGTEVVRRNDPFGPDRLKEIQRQVRKKFAFLETSAQRRAALVVWQYYLRAVYSKKPKGDGGGNDEEVKGLAHLYCTQLQQEWATAWGEEEFLDREIRSENLHRIGDLVGPLLKHFQLDAWVDYLSGSEEDVDASEVNRSVLREKCILKKEVFQLGWLEENVEYFRGTSAGASVSAGASIPSGAGGVGAPVPPPPPPAMGGIQFLDAGNGWLNPAINGQPAQIQWHNGQPYWIVPGQQPLLATQLQQAVQTPPPPGAGLIWAVDPSGWQTPSWQAIPGVPSIPAQIGWYGNSLHPTPCWIAGGQTISFTLAAAPVAAPSVAPSGVPPVPPPPGV